MECQEAGAVLLKSCKAIMPGHSNHLIPESLKLCFADDYIQVSRLIGLKGDSIFLSQLLFLRVTEKK